MGGGRDLPGRSLFSLGVGASIRVHETPHLPARDRTIRDSIPVTSLPRTLLDAAEVAPGRLRRAVDEADRLQLLDVREHQADSWTFHRGRRAFERDRERSAALQAIEQLRALMR